MPIPRIISYKLCPYVFRAVSTMHFKNLNFQIDFIDLSNKPEWFKKISPLGKVPIFNVENTVLFESTVIMEYIDQMKQPSLQPTNLLIKAKNQAHYQFAGEVLNSIRHFIMAPTQETFEAANKELIWKLKYIESQLGENNRYFNGNQVNLIDLCFSSIFVQLEIAQRYLNFNLYQSTPKVEKYANSITNLNAVQKAKVEDFDERFIFRSASKNAHFLTLKKRPVIQGNPMNLDVQKIRIFLEMNGTAYDFHIDNALETPILNIGSTKLNEIQSIMQYLEDTFERKTLPLHPLFRTECIGWISIANDKIRLHHSFQKQSSQINKVQKLLTLLEEKLSKNTKFIFGNYQIFSLVDAVYAPIFKQIHFYENYSAQKILQKYPKVLLYSENLLKQSKVNQVFPSNYNEEMKLKLSRQI